MSARVRPRTGKRSPPRVRLATDERRAQLLTIARRVFSNQPYDEVSIDDLAREARISKGLLYHYFPTKRDLYVAGLSQIADEMIASLSAISPEAAPIDRARAAFNAFLDHVERNTPAFVSLMAGGIGNDVQVRAVVERVRQRIVEMSETGFPLAPVVARDARYRITVRGWVGFVESAALAWCVERRISRSELVEMLVQLEFEIITSVLRRIMPSQT